MKRVLPLMLLGVASVASSYAQVPEAYFMADFNTEATMTDATVGKNMQFVNEVGETKYKPIEFISDGNGINKEDGYVYIPTGAYIKCDFSGLTGFTNPADPENPYVGTYTAVMDIKLPTLGTYYCLFQSNPYNNTDSKLCLNTSGNFGSGFLGGYSSSWAAEPDIWYRLTLTVNQADGRYALYADGNLIEEGTSGNVSKIDGRYALEEAGTLFFADDNEEDAPLYCTKLMFFDRALTDAEVKALGNPATEVSSAVAELTCKNNVKIYVKDNSIIINTDKTVNASLFNLSGQLVGTACVSHGETGVISADMPGIYLVVSTDATGVKSTKKIIVR